MPRNLLALVAAICLIATAHARAVDNIRVFDGDTIVLNGERIRLHGIDAPEARQSCQRDGKACRRPLCPG